MPKAFVRIALSLLSALFLAVAPDVRSAAASPASAWAETAHGAVRLVAATDAVGDGADVRLGLEFRMAPGWHVYWRSPGDAGYPPRIDWSGSGDVATAVMRWPAPERFSVSGLETMGYADAVLLPIDLRLQRPGEAATLRAVVDYLTCADICVPYVAELALDLPAGPAAPSAFAHDVARWAAAVPGDGAAAGLTLERVSSPPAVAGDGTLHLVVEVRAREPLTAPDVFLEGPPPLTFGAPEVALADGGRRATLSVAAWGADGLDRPLAGLPLTVTLTDGARAAEWPVVVAAAAAPPEPVPSLLPILALAVLGGLILNLMPCVLPVLSMKLLSVVGHGGGDRRAVRAGFVATAAGILFSFLLLAGALIALQAGGQAIGWGLQFQQPLFLVAMSLVVTLFACNLWGLFEVPLPGAVGHADAHAGRLGGPVGHFATGALATLLATPCSAPFLGTAVGFALARGPAEIVMVFAAVALGLALPYLAVAAVPSLATRLPRPGRWMLHLRRVLGVALAGTAAWLVWVLAGQIGVAAAAVVAALATAVVVALVVRRALPARLRAAPVVAVASLCVLALAVPPWTAREGRAASGVAGDVAGPWQPFAPERIAALVADGRTVFVTVTADWCLTCKVNERLVLSAEPVRTRLAGAEVVAMRADWTAPDPAISRYLASFGRYGIPFDAVYGPALPEGEALPELLTGETVLDALRRAEARPAG